MPFWAVCCRPWGSAGAGAHLEKRGFRVEGVSNFALRPFSRAATKHRKRNEKQHRKQPQKARKSARKNNHNKPSKMIIFGAKMAPKIDPGGLRRPIGGRRRTQEANQSTTTQTNRPQESAKSARKQKRRSQGGDKYAGDARGWAGAPGRGRGGVCNKESLWVLTPRNPAKLGRRISTNSSKNSGSRDFRKVNF